MSSVLNSSIFQRKFIAITYMFFLYYYYVNEINVFNVYLPFFQFQGKYDIKYWFIYLYIYTRLKKNLKYNLHTIIGRSITPLSILFIKGSWKARYRKKGQTKNTISIKPIW